MDSTEPIPLPKSNSAQVQHIADESPNYLSAYNVCLQHEEDLAKFENKLRHVRILRFLLLNAPNRSIHHEVTLCIHSCNNSSDLLTGLDAFFELYLILPLKKFKGRTPKPSEHPSRPSFEADKNKMKIDIIEAPKNHQAAKHRINNWRCVVTGIIDLRAPKDMIRELDPWTATFFCLDKSEENSKLDYSASILAVLKRFHYNIKAFNGEKVHSLANVMSMANPVHERFDRLELYFEATSQVNLYEVKWFGMKPHADMPRFVTFSTTDPVNLPVPAPELLTSHATCCKVAQLSGASEYIDKIYRDVDTIDVLSADGSSGDMLNYLLSSLSNPTGTVSVQS
ncbi:hypothetical protein BC826DRAFT_1049117 [Russula brevipes]|nr:hypothetical protein BC826DRAFT_1049117 [Russula brevipes]